MSETEHETDEDQLPPKPSAKQIALLTLVIAGVFIFTQFLLHRLFPAECRLHNGIAFLLTGAPIFLAGFVVLPVWPRGSSRPRLARESVLFVGIVIGNLLAYSSVVCIFENAPYATLAYMPVLAVLTHFVVARVAPLVAEATPAADPDTSGNGDVE